MKLNGPGKYDDLTTDVRVRANARGAIVLIFGGDKGSGFSVQAPPDLLTALPKLLRTMAIEIEQQLSES